MKMKANLFLITLFAISSIFTASAMHPSSPKASRFAKASQDKMQNKDNGQLGQLLIKAAKQNNLQEMQQLINDGADINAKNNHGWTALMRGALDGNINALNLLIKNGADINVKDFEGSTALMQAAFNGRTDALKLLIENGADINAKDCDGWTALIIAASYGETNALKLLIENGADINAKDNNGWTALITAAYWRKQPCYELLVEAMIAQEKATLCFLWCCKKAKENNSDLQLLHKNIAQLIAKNCWSETIKTRDEINKITNTEIKQNLLEKYFPEKHKKILTTKENDDGRCVIF